MAGAPSLASNLAVSPFRRTYQPEAQLRQPRTDGFSDDGLSYAVINDRDKIEAQIMAEFEARKNNPRIDIWGRPLYEDTPAGLTQELIAPYKAMTGDLDSDNALRTYKTKGGGVIGIDPYTGESKMLLADPEAPINPPQFSHRQKSDLKLVEDEILATRKLFNEAKTVDEKSALQGRLNSLERNRRKIFETEPPAETSTPTLTPQQRPIWADWPQQGSFIGSPGGANEFSSRLSPFTQPRQITKELAIEFLKQAKGDREAARRMARDAGYSF